jgi:hypothetical protein
MRAAPFDKLRVRDLKDLHAELPHPELVEGRSMKNSLGMTA